VVPITNPGVLDAVTLCAIRISPVAGLPVEKIGMFAFVDVYVGYAHNSIVKFDDPNAVAKFEEVELDI